MKIKLTSRFPEGTQPSKSLTQVLKDSELVRGMVKESADELASVNLALNEGFSDQGQIPEVRMALEKSEAVKIKVQKASGKLSQVNQALKKEVGERHRIEHQLATVMDQQKETLHAALHDPLTGLPNRVLFNDRLEHGMEQATRHGWTLAVMFMDLDKFKAINDSHGHDAGDAVLLTIAKRLKEATRTDDTVSRHGGDEFLYLLMEIDDDQDAVTVAKKIIKAVQVPCDISVGRLTVNTSIGISVFPRDGTTVEALMMSADAAMYRAKKEKSGFAFSSASLAQHFQPAARAASPVSTKR